MSAEVELLRHAAFHMRERALAATPGPWDSTENGDGQHLVFDAGRSMDVEVCSFDVRTVNLLRQGADAAHIASWHPAVALAVADWLESEAALAYEPAFARAPEPCALAVARAYLGEVSDAS